MHHKAFMILQASQPSSLLDQCIRGCRGKKLAEFLALRPIQVILTQRMMGSRLAAKQLGKILFDYPEMSATPVDTVVNWVESGVIQVTEAQLREAALASETATDFLARYPWLTDPTGESIPRTRGRKASIKSEPSVKPPKKTKDNPKASDASGESTIVPAPDSPADKSGTELPKENNPPSEENKPQDLNETKNLDHKENNPLVEENKSQSLEKTDVEGENKAPKPRRGVKMPPDMTSNDYQAAAPKPLDVKVQGLKEEASD